MPNIASVLKEEIVRLARKEVSRQTQGLRTSVSAHRSEIAALKRKNQELERELRQLRRGRQAPEESGPSEEKPANRFSAKGLAKHRSRLGLSAADFGALIGASGLSVYKWEKGEARPRDKYIAAIAEARKLGKREAFARLALLTGT